MAVLTSNLPPELPLVLFPKKSKFLVAGSTLFVGIGVWMVFTGDTHAVWLRYTGLAFFWLAAVAALVQLFGEGSFLRLDEVGFTLRHVFRSTSLKWGDIDKFFVVQIGRGFRAHPMVAWNSW